MALFAFIRNLTLPAPATRQTRPEIARLFVHASILASGTINFLTADNIVTLYSTETIEEAVDLQGPGCVKA
jgi:hypothetical protein